MITWTVTLWTCVFEDHCPAEDWFEGHGTPNQWLTNRFFRRGRIVKVNQVWPFLGGLISIFHQVNEHPGKFRHTDLRKGELKKSDAIRFIVSNQNGKRGQNRFQRLVPWTHRHTKRGAMREYRNRLNLFYSFSRGKNLLSWERKFWISGFFLGISRKRLRIWEKLAGKSFQH